MVIRNWSRRDFLAQGSVAAGAALAASSTNETLIYRALYPYPRGLVIAPDMKRIG